MQILDILDERAMDLTVREIHQRPVLMQFPSVFVLLAAPTRKGAGQLDLLKTRLDGKNYGTAIGSLEQFIAQASRDCLPEEFNCAAHFDKLTGTFIRLQFRDEAFDSKTIRGGTHQGLLLGGVYQELFRRIEDSFASYPPEEIWDGRNYCAPLCTSCNVSGDPEGSIVEMAKALAFARQRGVELFITTSQPAAERGSYPIFGFRKDKVSIHRDGPGLEVFKQRIPQSLRSW